LATNIRVLKFGGTSVADTAAFERAVEIVRANHNSRIVVVVSAMSGVTDALIAVSNLEEHFERHLRVAQILNADQLRRFHEQIENSKLEIFSRLPVASADLRTRDEIASYGERLCGALFATMLEHHDVPASYVDARTCILTDDVHGNANPLMDEVCSRTRAQLDPVLESRRVPVLGGFIGATADGITTTLGRGSSDYTATLIGAVLQAEEIQIWTDVDGVQTANPNLVTTTRTVPVISYEEARELAALGARVMHPKMIGPVIENKIPIRIRNSRFPERSGTLICAGTELPNGFVKAIAHREGVVACVGDGLSNGSLGAASVRRVLREIDPALAWQSTSASNLITTVEPDQAPELVKRLHARIFEREMRKGATALDRRA
jgi:aspartate kinase